MIQVRSLSKRLDGRALLDKLSFDVDPGEFFGLFGPPGSGKSAIAHLLSGLLAPDAGRIMIEGGGDPRTRAARRQIGFVPQALALYESLSAEQNARFFARLYGLSGDKLDQHVGWALDFVRLGEWRHEPVRRYSQGMARRLNLACALVHNPPVLVLDEPLSGADAQSRSLMLDNLRHLKEHGRTIVYCSPSLADVSRLCDKVAIIDQGRILALDTIEDLVAGYGGPTQVTVTFAEDEAPNLDQMPGSVENGVWRFPTEDPILALQRLARAGYAVASIHVEAPGLESVYESLTGRRSRD